MKNVCVGRRGRLRLGRRFLHGLGRLCAAAAKAPDVFRHGAGRSGGKAPVDDDKGAVHEEKVFQPLGVAEGELEEFQSCRRRLHFLMAVPALNRRLGYGGHGTGGCLQHALSPCLVDRGKARDGQRLAVAVGVPVYGA